MFFFLPGSSEGSVDEIAGIEKFLRETSNSSGLQSKRKRLSELDEEEGFISTKKKSKVLLTEALPLTPRKRGRSQSGTKEKEPKNKMNTLAKGNC